MTPPSGWVRLDADHAFWPVVWTAVADPPAAVLVTGDPSALAGPCLSIVGTRGASARGLAVAHGLARALAARGWVIVSGLARGVDAQAHLGALAAGGRTIAVMATGPERTYPAEHTGLRRRIEAAGGCAITEGEPDTSAQRWLFPRRNRLIAQLGRGLVVVEAPARSGALITVVQALEAGRDVMAVPGPVDRPECEGCNELLREGAAPVWTAAHVEEVVGRADADAPATADDEGPPLPAAGSAARWIYDRVDLEGVDHGQLATDWPGTREMWTEGLLALELAGLIRRLPGGKLARSIWRP